MLRRQVAVAVLAGATSTVGVTAQTRQGGRGGSGGAGSTLEAIRPLAPNLYMAAGGADTLVRVTPGGPIDRRFFARLQHERPEP